MRALVLGISTDDLGSHAAFREKYGLAFSLVSDTDRSISRRHGVLDEARGWARQSPS
jgi:peroxiredoxin Q/BCP